MILYDFLFVFEMLPGQERVVFLAVCLFSGFLVTIRFQIQRSWFQFMLDRNNM